MATPKLEELYKTEKLQTYILMITDAKISTKY